ncbi:uncharacterized protein K452DRAFT_317541 [Aplosporella prunicola CBS 121167]|uniref:Uncharacterized protein n=1 Tax=Aplosporella prunicola CBS 121167 TaxID=1176127 RepID=A0A6A6BLE4_9PEZI|nr:uncharacterized protein K452DRAFT_317541 [Aplosporella prunicola CBS 121167]KAF2143391.1 hypothetical protein K452DRAFT_317541 [Aplosporella prunicola CBS 121167]
MDKLKNLISPGHQQDDDVLYRGEHSNNPSTHSTNTTKTSGEGSHFKDARDSGLSSHAVNPSDSHYSQSGFGTDGPATSTLPDRTAQKTGSTNQTLNPIDREYGESRYGTTGTTEPTHTPAAGGIDAPVGGTSQNFHLGSTTRTERDAAGTGTDRHFPLSGGSVAGHGRTGDYGAGDTTGATGRDSILSGATGSYDNQRAEPGAFGSHGVGSTSSGPTGDYGNTSMTGSHGTRGSHGNEALAGAAAAASMAGHGHGHGNEGIDTRNTDTAEPHFASGPHVTETANRLDPHVSGSTGLPSASHMGSSGPETTAGYGSGIGATSTAPGYDTSSATAGPTSHDQGHHYGRDAAIAGGVGAAGAGLYEARSKGSTTEDPASMTHGPHKSNIMNVADPRVLPDTDKMKGHHAESTATDPAPHTTGPHKSDVLNVLDPRVLPEPEKMKQHTTAGPHQSDTLNRMDPNVDSNLSSQQGQHHHGRDAALAGGAGAGGFGAYEGNKRLHNAAGPHQSDTTNRADPRVDSDLSQQGFGASEGNKRLSNTAGPHHSDTMNRADPRVDSDRSQQSQHHYGRDAALAGGAGAGGFGAYEADKHHKNTAGPHQSDTMNKSDPRVDSDLSQQGRHHKTTAGPHKSDAMNKADPRVDSDRSQENQHHYGRDAALAGGAGVGAAGAYESAKHHNDHNNPYTASAIDPRVDGNRTSAAQRGPATATYGSTASQPQSHQYQRDAAGAPGVGAAGAGAPYDYSKREAEKAEKERIKKLEKEAKKNEPEEKKHHGILGFLHRDKDKKDKHDEEPTTTHHTTARDTATTSHPDTTEKAAHRAEAAALGTGTVGAGAGAYGAEHERNRLHKDPPADHPASQALQGEQYGMSGALGQPGAASELGTNDPNALPMGDDGIVIEPRTGLPMNVGKYGTGVGGTDSNPTIHGYHGETTGAAGNEFGENTTGTTGTAGTTGTTSHMAGTGSSVGHGNAS